jgi:hypothetical protein
MICGAVRPGLLSCARESAGQSLPMTYHRQRWRKVRAPADQVPGNAWGARAHGKCNREQTAQALAANATGDGKGETVR